MDFNETPEQARQIWTDALRSGQYGQCTGRLCDLATNTFCCLGVACELFADRYPHILKRVDHNPAKVDGGRWYESVVGGQVTARLGDLPDVVQLWLGLESPIGHTRAEYYEKQRVEQGRDEYDDAFEALPNLNDEVGLDFSEIADVIDGGHIETV